MPMGAGAIVWTYLVLTAHQAPPAPYHLNSRNMGIGLNINAATRNEAKEFNLLASTDQGLTWQQAAKIINGASMDNQFRYYAHTDGEYWFIVQQVDQEGRATPANPSRARPNQVTIVDTVPPQIDVKAERLADGKVQVNWSVSEKYPEDTSVRIDFRSETGQWMPTASVAGKFPLQGSHSFNPANSGLIHVRVQAKDLAQNVGEKEIAVAAAAPTSPGAPARPEIGLIPTMRAEQPGQLNQLTSQQTPRPALVAPPPPTAPAPAPSPPSGLPIPSNFERMPSPTGGLTETPANSPAVKIVKSREVRLDFTVNKVGPSGIGNADVWVTLDRGKRWDKMPREATVSLAQNADLQGAETVSGSVSVQLPNEATTYGFIVAVKSKAGLAPPPPKPGDPPELLVELDTTAPKGQLFKPQPDPSQPNTLLLAWEAKDRNLAEAPITLEWAKDKDGPWNPINEGPLPNSGQYPWRLPNNLPPRVYLRLTMRDLAGNESRAQTPQPELIDLSVPQTKLIGVAAGSR